MPGASHHSPASAPPPGRVAGRYALLSRIAVGGTGEVWAARELATDRRLAIKRMLPGRRCALFQAEYHTLAQLRHPFIVQVYDFGFDQGLPYYTMELLDGHDLRAAARPGLEEGCRILRDVACSLSLLHAQNLLHRDISPGNVRRTAAGRGKLLDFGSMVPFGVPKDVAGTPGFISPEAAEGAHLDQRADLYSLGALAYWLFSRRLPGDLRLRDGAPTGPSAPPKPLGQLVPELPAQLHELVMALLDPDPSRRPSSAVEVTARLSAAGGLASYDMPALAQSHLGSARFVGQDAAKQAAAAAVERLDRGRGGALLVQGPTGVGKSRLLSEMALAGQTAGCAVIRAFAARGVAKGGVAHQVYGALRWAAPEVFGKLARPAQQALSDSTRPKGSALPLLEAEAPPHSALCDDVQEVTTRGSCMVLVDDIDLADPFSVSFVATLATLAQTLPLLIVCSETTLGDEVDALSAYRARAQTLTLDRLGAAATDELLAEIFGAVPNRAQLSAFLQRETEGNPALMLAVCKQLLERGVIRYRDGSFVLPGEEIHSELSAQSVGPVGLPLDGLSARARELLELLALCRRGASLELCLSAASGSNDEVLGGLAELVARDLLVGGGEEYVLAGRALRSAVAGRLSASETRTRHAQLAQAHLVQGAPSPQKQLEVGWHLVHSERTREGAERLLEAAPPLLDSGVHYREAISGLEKALEVFESTADTESQVLQIRVLLAACSYRYDHRLAKYAEDTIALLREWCGLNALQRVGRRLPGFLWVGFCCLTMFWKRLTLPRARCGPAPQKAIHDLLLVVMSTIGVRLTGLDGRGARRLLTHLDFLRHLPARHPVTAIRASARALCVQPFGREAELSELLEVALGATARKWPRVQDEERRDLRVGLKLSRAINECYRCGSRALELADELAREDTPLARVAAHRVRFAFYTVRGMRHEAEAHRRELDVCGLLGGTTWQVEWFAVPIEGMSSAVLGDVVGAGRALERLEGLVREVPSLSPMRDMVSLAYHMRRGDYDLAIELGARFVQAFPPRSVIGWGSAYAAYAAALNRAERWQEARELCEGALAVLSPDDRAFVVLYGGLVRELGVAHAGLGDGERSAACNDELLARLQAGGEHALLAHGYAYRALSARMLADNSQVALALVSMRDAAEQAGSTTVIEQAARTTRDSLRPESAGPVCDDDPDAVELPPKESFVTQTGNPRQRRRSLLGRLMAEAQAEAALVFSRDAEGTLKQVMAVGASQASVALSADLEGLLSSPPHAHAPVRSLVADGTDYHVVELGGGHDLGSWAVVVLVAAEAPGQVTASPLLYELAEQVLRAASQSDPPECVGVR